MNHSKAFRVLGPVVTAALVAGLALLATALGRTQAGAATPWLNQPARVAAAPVARADAAECGSNDISVRLARRGIVQDGSYAYVYAVRNVSGKTCYVSGYPRITVGGKAVAHGPNVLSVGAGDLRPGQIAMFAVTQTTTAGCSAGDSQNGVLKQTAEAALMSVGTHRPGAIGGVLVSKCSRNAVTAIGLAPAEPKPDALSRLYVRLDMPKTATAGQTLKFQVMLTNPTRKSIRLSPCPSYEIGISVAGEHAYRLNCANPVIAAGQSRAFEMEYRLPAGTQAGLAKIGWLLLNPSRTGSGTFIDIVN